MKTCTPNVMNANVVSSSLVVFKAGPFLYAATTKLNAKIAKRNDITTIVTPNSFSMEAWSDQHVALNARLARKSEKTVPHKIESDMAHVRTSNSM